MSKDPKEFLLNCIKCYSPSGKEARYSQFLANFLKESNIPVRFDQIGNLIAKKGSGAPILLLVSHMDTIPGELPVYEENGKIYGRGAVDCKPSLAAMLYSFCDYELEEQDTGTIIFSGIVREEDSLVGINEFVKSDVNPDFAIFGEPTNYDQICIGYKGRLCIGYKVNTKAGHVAASWEFVSANEICLEIWNIIKAVCWNLNEIHKEHDKKLKYFNKIIPNLSIISGGELTNCVPSKCVMYIDIRFPPKISSKTILSEIRKAILDFKHVYSSQHQQDFKIHEQITSLLNGFEVKNNNILIGALRWSIFNECNIKPKLIKKTGTTFINKIGLHYKIPSITYGPGDPKLEHTDKEFVEIKEYLKVIEIYKRFYPKFFELFRRKIQK
ncbi:MAG: M20/M25/M40 family metallo-hydrolase [Candidatus Lokiarchaeota archaeon]|nr:M20/M25/M40 family metallo-hydrolase [Candidatus Lokiarchaeota archaeon]MBD3342700.1 M20/M25/M40 family metallo-hydrolase [Candidatus Lokiarchaeota archaeon]